MTTPAGRMQKPPFAAVLACALAITRDPDRPQRRILVSLLTDARADLDLARRRIGYDHLVLIATPAQEADARAVEQVEQGLGGCDVHVVEGGDVDAILRTLRAIMADHGDAQVSLNAAGGTHAMSTAMMIYAYETGHPTWFCQEGRHVRLPVFEGVGLVERVDDEGHRLLSALPHTGAFAETVAQSLDLDVDHVARVARRLEEQGLLRSAAIEGRFHLRPTAAAQGLAQDQAPGP